MKGKKLSIEDLEKLKRKTRVVVFNGYFTCTYRTDTYEDQLCLITEEGFVQFSYADLYKLDIFEYVEEKQYNHKDWFSSMPYIKLNVDIDKDALDELNKELENAILMNPTFITYDQETYKPQMRIVREFNIAKKKENEVSKRSRQEKLKYIMALMEIKIDQTIEQMNKGRFITLTGRLNKLRKACEVI